MCKYTYITHDENYCYAMDMEHEKMMAIPYSMEEENMKMDFDGCKMAKVKLMAKSDDESDTDDIYMSLKSMFSSNVYVDNNAMQELNDKAAENNKQLSEEQMKDENDKDKIIAGMSKELNEVKDDLSKIKSDITAYAEENKKLKDFKASVEKQNKDFEVETTLNEVMSILPKEEIDSCRMSAENFNLESLDTWKNEVQAKAFKFSKGIIEKKPYIQIGLPIISDSKSKKGLWD
jgi:cell division protein FtsB